MGKHRFVEEEPTDSKHQTAAMYNDFLALPPASVSNGDDCMRMYEIFPKEKSWSVSFEGFSLQATAHPRQEPDYDWALQMNSLLNSNRLHEAVASSRSYFLNDPIPECPVENDVAKHKCTRCSRPAYGFCQYCNDGQNDRECMEVATTNMEKKLKALSMNDCCQQLGFHAPPAIKMRKPHKSWAIPQSKLELEAQIPTTGLTTLMIRNIPSQYTPEMLVREWPNEGTYDFLYLPCNSQTKRNLTYAFVNFTSPDFAIEFRQQWQKMRLEHFMVQKPLNIGFADVQGRNENVIQLKKKRLLYTKAKQCQPLVFNDGIRIPLESALSEAEMHAWMHQYLTL